MGLYLLFIKKAFQQRFTYRLNSYFTIFGTILGLIVMLSIWTALYSDKDTVNGITLQDMISFVVINVLVSAIINSNIHSEIGKKVQDGSLSIDFIKPIDFKLYLFANQIGENLFRIVFNSLPACIFVLIFWGITLPDRIEILLFFILSLILGVIIYFQISYILGLTVFWLKSSFFVDWLSRAMMRIFAGSFVPLWFYPDVLLTLCQVLPFRFITFEPIAIFVGKTSIQEAWGIIGLQLVWIVSLLLIEKVVWHRGQKIIDIYGG